MASSKIRLARDHAAETHNVMDYGYTKDNGIVADGTDDSSSVQAALNAVNTAGGGTVFFPSPATYLIGAKLTVGSNTTVEIPSGVTVKLADGVDDKMFENKDTTGGNSFIRFIGHGILEGNKSNQTVGQSSRGIYLVNCSDSGVGPLTVQNFEDHGIHYSLDGTQENNWVYHTILKSNGVNASSVGGSGFASTSADGLVITGVQSSDNFRTGLRLGGTDITVNGGVLSRNGQGGIVPVAGGSDITINGVICRNNTGDVAADGIRLVGIDRVIINGALCSGNDGSGILVRNGCNNIQINNPICRNNGQNATARAGTTGRDGVTVKNDGTANTNILINNPRCYDDQGSPTQDYGVAIENSSDNITLQGGDLSGNETASLLNSTSGDDVIIKSGIRGLDYDEVDNSVAAHTGTTDETDLKSVTIPANQFGKKNGFRLITTGEISGTAGTKTIRVKIGASFSTITVNLSAGETDDWVIEAEVWNISTTSQRILLRGFQGTTFESNIVGTASEDFTGAIAVRTTGTLGNAGDTITTRTWRIEPIR